ARNLLHEVAEAPNRPPYARLNRGIADLLMGCFPHGLEDMTARWQLPDQYIKRRVTDDLPNWVGAPLKGLRLVVYGEQGLGDAIQCVRFVPRLVEAGAEVTLAVDEALHPLLAQLGVPMVEEVDAAEGYDARVSVMDVPMVARIGLSDLWPGAPYLTTEPQRVAAWRARLGERFKVAFAWSGKPSMRVNARRSFPPSLVTALGRVPGVRLISVQKGAEVGALPIETLEELDADGAFLDTAAVMQACDLVITCDTSIAHLAGALGCPVWIGLRAVPDWRWMLERSDSPWYPSAVLFRQTAPGDWSSVERGMVAALTELTAS
ncbi:MAG: glycosyltransferase, partial [Pseudomonadota bacterium]